MTSPSTQSDSLIFQQLFDPVSSTFTYLLADSKSREAVLIDPVLEKVDRDLKLIAELNLNLTYVIDTHIHADHVTGAGEIRARLPSAKTVTAQNANVACTNEAVGDGERIYFGSRFITVLETPGHTNASMSFVCEGMVFTGDTLLIRGCGRTDFQGGSSAALFKSVKEKLFTLPQETIVYPGHDYNGFTSSTIGNEIDFNPRLGRSQTLEAFEELMAKLKLPYPKQIDTALTMNLSCGVTPTFDVPTVEPRAVQTLMVQNSALIDVRTKAEYESDAGYVPGSHRVTLGEGLQKFLETYPKNKGLIFVCQSGRRSQEAAKSAMTLGFTKVASLKGGLDEWKLQGLQIERYEDSLWFPVI